MNDPAPFDAAPQHGPRPLPLFLELLRSETASSPYRRAAALAGLNAYQNAPRRPRPVPMPIVATAGRAVLRDYGGSGPPVIFVPSLINPPFVLDLMEGNSLLRWLANQGVRPLLVDWGTPGPDDRACDISEHIEALLLPLIDALGEPAFLTGYCLGGTMAIAAATLRPGLGLALIATPWNFHGFPEDARAEMAKLWSAAQPICTQLGYLPMEVLQTGFWQLDPARTISKYEHFSTLDPTSDAAQSFIALEDWANGGAPLTLAAGKQAFEDFFGANQPGETHWQVGGKRIDPLALTIPVIDIISRTDRIVPATSATGIVSRIEIGTGHVGMVVGSRAKDSLWKPLAAWLSQMQHK